jgi:hypothetical protein
MIVITQSRVFCILCVAPWGSDRQIVASLPTKLACRSGTWDSFLIASRIDR